MILDFTNDFKESINLNPLKPGLGNGRRPHKVKAKALICDKDSQQVSRGLRSESAENEINRPCMAAGRTLAKRRLSDSTSDDEPSDSLPSTSCELGHNETAAVAVDGKKRVKIERDSQGPNDEAVDDLVIPHDGPVLPCPDTSLSSVDLSSWVMSELFGLGLSQSSILGPSEGQPLLPFNAYTADLSTLTVLQSLINEVSSAVIIQS
jgi:hypothetical protein